jgi:CheY-like chemotaxis protein
MDGYEVCRRIRQEAWGRELTVVALTGWGQEEDRQRSRDAGFDAHLVKPVDYDQLEKLVASLPSARSAGAPIGW